MSKLLEGKVALITGASRDIGEAAAYAFADAGAAVALAARDSEALERVAKVIVEKGGRAIALPTDVTDEAAVRQMVERTVDKFGSLHLAFNNAGGAAGFARGALVDVDADLFNAVIALNILGPFLSMKYEVPAMIASGGGAIVNSSALAGVRVGSPLISPLAAAKHGLQGLTKAAAIDYADQGVRVNAIAIGTVPPRSWLADRPEEFIASVSQAVPMKRLGTAEEVAAAALWLCSDQASYVTGATVPVDGGLAAN